MTFLRINYGVNRAVRRKGRKVTFEHKCGKLRVKGAWSAEKTHQRIRQLIREKNPNWHITGYTKITKSPGKSSILAPKTKTNILANS